MATRGEAAKARLERHKDQVNRLLAQVSDARLAAGRVMVQLEEMGVSKTEISELWNTSRAQVDKMILRAKIGR